MTKGFGQKKEKVQSPKATERTFDRLFFTEEEVEEIINSEFKGMVQLFLTSPKGKYALKEYVGLAHSRDWDIILIELSKSPTVGDLERQQAITTMVSRESFEGDENEPEDFKADVLQVLDSLPVKKGFLWVIFHTKTHSKQRLFPHAAPCGSKR